MVAGVMFLQAALLGVVQGLTEFLPVSSSAHLILARAFFGWNVDQFGLAFDVACHVGTLLALAVYFRRELQAITASAPFMFAPAGRPPARVAQSIAIGTVPVVVVGALLSEPVQQSVRTPAVAGVALAVGAIALLVAERAASRARGEESVTAAEAFAVGCAQAAALIPGVSRSGATIAVGMLLGLRRDAAARFGFLLGVPAVFAAGAREAAGLAGQGLTLDAALLFGTGMTVSAVVGYFTIKYFVRYLAGHSLHLFVGYRLALAATVFVWLV